EQQNPEHDVRHGPRQIAPVDHMTDEVLARPVRGAVGVRELVRAENRVVCPRWDASLEPTEEDLLTLNREAPVRVKHCGDTGRREVLHHNWRTLVTRKRQLLLPLRKHPFPPTLTLHAIIPADVRST